MARRGRSEDRLIPHQDKRICGGICCCQLMVVFSCVSFIYLAVAIYIPAYRAFNSGFLERPIMCQTVNTSTVNNCSWASCGEWCLTKTSGFCPQIHVTTRQNGTIVQFQECTDFTSVSCPAVNHAALKRYNCNNGTECATLRGVFNCSLGHCSNMSEAYHCHHKADGSVLDSDKDNVKLNGYFECKGSKCTKIKRAFNCDRFCPMIDTNNKNIFITSGDHLYAAECKRIVAFTEANGNEEGRDIEPEIFWESHPDDDMIIMTSCQTVGKNSDGSIDGIDCINGTIYDYDIMPDNYINFTTFWEVQQKWRDVVDKDQKYLPMQDNLTISYDTHLYINLEGCVNTLRGECRQFFASHGRDGRDNTAPSRFHCYYNKDDASVAIARFDLAATYRELVIAATIPSILFLTSFTGLCVTMKCVRVGDDTKMRCRYCGGSDDNDNNMCEMTAIRYVYDEVSSPIEELAKRDKLPLVKA